MSRDERLRELALQMLEITGISMDPDELDDLRKQAGALMGELARLDELEPELSGVEPALSLNLHRS